MAEIGFEALVIFLLVLANGVFALSEIAIVSSRKARLQQRAEEGDAGARAALDLAQSPNRFLSTVQIGITLVGVMAGAFGGATLAEELAGRIARVPALARSAETIAVTLVVLGITYLSLVVGELVPKRLALNNPEAIAGRIARPMKRLSQLTAPVVHLLTGSTDLVLRLLRARPSTEPPVSEDEIHIMIEQGTEAGVFEESEQQMVRGVFRLGDRRVDAIMTPRTEIEWLERRAPSDEIVQLVVRSGHTRFPVAEGSLDHVAGVARARDILSDCLAGRPVDLGPLLEPPHFLPESTPALDALELLRAKRASMAFVIDEYGGVQGLITSSDIMEAVLGDSELPGPAEEARALRREDGSWLLDGMLPADELEELLGLEAPPGAAEGHYQTLGGLVMAFLGHIPAAGDSFEHAGLRFEVLDMDGHRVDKVLVSRAGLVSSPTPFPSSPLR